MACSSVDLYLLVSLLIPVYRVVLTGWGQGSFQTVPVCLHCSILSYCDTLVPEDHWPETLRPWSQNPDTPHIHVHVHVYTCTYIQAHMVTCALYS